MPASVLPVLFRTSYDNVRCGNDIPAERYEYISPSGDGLIDMKGPKGDAIIRFQHDVKTVQVRRAGNAGHLEPPRQRFPSPDIRPFQQADQHEAHERAERLVLISFDGIGDGFLHDNAANGFHHFSYRLDLIGGKRQFDRVGQVIATTQKFALMDNFGIHRLVGLPIFSPGFV